MVEIEQWGRVNYLSIHRSALGEIVFLARCSRFTAGAEGYIMSFIKTHQICMPNA